MTSMRTATKSIARIALGAKAVGHGAPAPRRDHDQYDTEDGNVTRALMASPAGALLRAYGRVREPACGTGAMAMALEREGLDVVSSDIAYRGFGFGQVDFLGETSARGCKALVTNPPFTYWMAPRWFSAGAPMQWENRPPSGVRRQEVNGQGAFLRKAAELGFETVALFHKAQFWHTQDRLALWDFWRPAYVMPLTWRPDFTGEGSPPMDCAWSVWTRAWVGNTSFMPLPKPAAH